MVTLRSFLLVLVWFYSACGLGASVENFESALDSRKGFSRADTPYSQVSLSPNVGDPESTLFGSCIAESRKIEATFASIEVVPGSEYIRLVPDALQARYPVSWQPLEGVFTTFFECAEAANDEEAPMFQYDGVKCDISNDVYALEDKTSCDGTEDPAGAVYILSTANFEGAMPRIYVGNMSGQVPIYAVINEELMTAEEASAFCLSLYRYSWFPSFDLFQGAYPPLTVADVITNFTSLGYSNTDLWTDGWAVDDTTWSGSFEDTDWLDGGAPANSEGMYALMDKSSDYKLVAANGTTVRAGALCTTSVGG